ncbi:hypothetical protein [Halopenitus persicus]|uniref:Uncharacterized protein n=1 Tax=Halopenitus persicus TaxID=1048396 RepID=A0A1H3JLB9_9EURY|nr:hypothetical protein [Halopenitus persicus]SDY40325.1 hypothetical protein SAMN05216564_10547 [Halopenitus persicus]
MSDRSPPPNSRRWLPVIALLSVLIIGYALIIAGQILLGLIPVLGLVLLYLVWRFVVAVEEIADAHQRLAAHQERQE